MTEVEQERKRERVLEGEGEMEASIFVQGNTKNTGNEALHRRPTTTTAKKKAMTAERRAFKGNGEKEQEMKRKKNKVNREYTCKKNDQRSLSSRVSGCHEMVNCALGRENTIGEHRSAISGTPFHS